MNNIICFLCVLLTHGIAASKPIAVVHIGPPKTGTTFIQAVLFKLKGDLLKENYAVITHDNKPNMYPLGDCFFSPPRHNTPKETCTTMIRTYRTLFQTHLNANRNIILSAETFSSPEADIGILFELLQGFQPLVIMSMRNSFSMLHSYFFEMCKPEVYEERCQELRDKEELTIESYLVRGNIENKISMLYNRTVGLARRISQLVGKDNIRIIDFDGCAESGVNIAGVLLRLIDISHEFLSDHSEAVTNMGRRNVGRPLDYHQVYVGAIRRGILPKYKSLPVHGHVLPDTLEGEMLPKKCMSLDIQNRMIAISLNFDKELRNSFPLQIVESNRYAMIKNVQKITTDESLCFVDEEKFFASSVWVKWLTSHARS